MKKIYIIGPVGSGKTTLANKLSKKYKIKAYELDKVVWDDSKHVKRSERQRDKLFNNIISKSSWIIEDVGRECFIRGIKEADIVYYINLPSIIIYKRCIFRWIKQIFGIEKSNYKQNVKTLINMFKWAKKDITNREEYISYIKKITDNLKIISNKDI